MIQNWKYNEKQKCLPFPLNHLKFNGSKGRWLIPWTRSKRRKRKIISENACSKSAQIGQKSPLPNGVKREKGKVSQKTLVQKLQKSSKNSLPQQQSSNINFNLSCTMQFPILTFRLGWNNSTKLQHIMIFQFIYLSFKSIKCMFACLLHKLYIQVAEVFRAIITITMLCR